LGYTIILLVEKIIFDNSHDKKRDNEKSRDYIELEKINNNDVSYKSPEIKLYNINNNFNISLESIAEAPVVPKGDRRESRSKTTKELKSPFPKPKGLSNKIATNVIMI
jgi:hypothetical protein